MANAGGRGRWQWRDGATVLIVWVPMYEIEIHRTFSAAHAIRLDDGTLEPVHGHDWDVTVVVAADDLDAMEVVMDFHALGATLDALLVNVHNRHLNEVAPFADADRVLKINPTAERVAWWLGQEVARDLPKAVRLEKVTVGEAPGCTATYRPVSISP